MNIHVRSDSDVCCKHSRTVAWGPGRDRRWNPRALDRRTLMGKLRGKWKGAKVEGHLGEIRTGHVLGIERSRAVGKSKGTEEQKANLGILPACTLEPSEKLKTFPASRPHPQRLWFNWSGVGPWHWHFINAPQGIPWCSLG